MNNPKLFEAIDELENQRRIIDDAILHLRRALSALGSTELKMATGTSSGESKAVGIGRASTGSSYVDQAVDAIQAAGHALHANALVDYIASVRGERPARASVESSIIRHIAKTKEPKLVKSGPSTYDLTIYSQRSLPIAS